MANQRTEQHQARQQHKRAVVWGCDIHKTPRGQECQGYADQYQLLTWNDIRPDRRRAR